MVAEGVVWAIDECFEEAKGKERLDLYQMPRWDGRYQHITLAMLARAYLIVTKHQTRARHCLYKRRPSNLTTLDLD